MKKQETHQPEIILLPLLLQRSDIEHENSYPFSHSRPSLLSYHIHATASQNIALRINNPFFPPKQKKSRRTSFIYFGAYAKYTMNKIESNQTIQETSFAFPLAIIPAA